MTVGRWTAIALSLALLACSGPRGEAGEGDPVTPRASAAPQPIERSPVMVELTHDLICPWCRIGHARLEQAIARFEAAHPTHRVAILYRPFLLEPSTPPEGFDLRERLGAKYGADRLDAMFERVRAIGEEDGLIFRFERIERTPDTRPAHALVLAAPEPSRPRLLAALHAAYFEEGRDISARGVLAELWTAAGLPLADLDAALATAATLDEALRDARRPSIRGVPHFVIGAQELGGAQPVEALLKALESALL